MNRIFVFRISMIGILISLLFLHSLGDEREYCNQKAPSPGEALG
jgi:hypothetical protein